MRFAAQSAAEVMTRQRKRRDPSRLSWLRIQHHSCGGFNGWWRRLPYEHAGQPVFAQGGRFLYFRPSSSQKKQQTHQGDLDELQATQGSRGGGLESGYSAPRTFVTATMRNCWVIDHTIRGQGLPFSGSLSAQLEGPWASPDEVYRDRRRGNTSAEAPGTEVGSGGAPPRLSLRIEASSVGVRGYATVALARGNDHRLPVGLKVRMGR